MEGPDKLAYYFVCSVSYRLSSAILIHAALRVVSLTPKQE